jgi:hypothetical protein
MLDALVELRVAVQHCGTEYEATAERPVDQNSSKRNNDAVGHSHIFDASMPLTAG